MPGPAGVSKAALALTVTVVIANLGNNIVAPVMPAIKSEFGAGAAQMGLMVSGFGLGRLLLDLPAGYMADRVSPTRLFTFGILLSAAASALAAASTSLEQLIVFRTAMGIGSTIMHTVALVMLVTISRPEHRGRVLSFFTSGMLLGQAVSPMIGGYLGVLINWRAAFVFCALTPFISFPLNLMATSRAVAQPGPAAHGRVSRGHGRQHGGYTAPTTLNRVALAAVFFSAFANFFDRQGMRSSLLPLYGGLVLGMDTATIGTILTVGSLVTIVASIPIGEAADRFGKRQLLIPGLLSLVAGSLFLLLGDTQAVFVGSVVLISMGVLANNMQSGLVADLVPEKMVGRAIGLYRFLADFGLVVGPVVLGAVVDGHGFGAASAAGAAVVGVSIVTTLMFVPRKTGALAAG